MSAENKRKEENIIDFPLERIHGKYYAPYETTESGHLSLYEKWEGTERAEVVIGFVENNRIIRVIFHFKRYENNNKKKK